LGLRTAPLPKAFVAQIEIAARTMGIAITTIEVSGEGEFEAAFSTMAREHVDVVIIQPSLLHNGLVELALKYRLPSFSPNRLLPAMGGLISYGTSFVDLYRTTVVFIDKILRGATPTDIPGQQQVQF